MSSLRLFLAGACIVAMAGAGQPVHSQSSGPDFSGSWSLIPATSGSSEPLGNEGVITQDGSRVTLSGGSRPITVWLDGRESTTSTASGWTLLSQARWVTNALLITTKYRTPIGQWEDMVICSLEVNGDLSLVALTTPKAPARAMITRRFVYKKKS